jgi:molybdopterin molybdotransferase
MTDHGHSHGRPPHDEAVEAVLSLRDDLLADVRAESETERVSLDHIAGRVLAESVVAESDVPPESRATMDGVAVDADDEPPLSLAGERVTPGDDPSPHEPGTARRVATGGPLPAGADAVVPREKVSAKDGAIHVDPVDAGQHVVARASVVEAGETVLEAGRRLAPRDAATLRDLGYDTVPVRPRLSTAVLATGTEIDEGREPDRDSEFLANLVRSWGGTPVPAGSVPDDPARVGERIAALAADHDVVVTTGGTGVGRTDETRDVLGETAEVRVENPSLRPGSSTTGAWLPDTGTVVVSLPGPPGAAFAGATLLCRPLSVGRSRLPTLAGELSCDLPVPDRDLTFVVPVEFRGIEGSADRSDPLSAVPFGHPASTVQLYGERFRPHRVATCARLSTADGFVLTGGDLAAGERIAIVPYTAVES